MLRLILITKINKEYYHKNLMKVKNRKIWILIIKKNKKVRTKKINKVKKNPKLYQMIN
jgi:hypothetical protein